jgi:hypothetical protein
MQTATRCVHCITATHLTSDCCNNNETTALLQVDTVVSLDFIKRAEGDVGALIAQARLYCVFLRAMTASDSIAAAPRPAFGIAGRIEYLC